MLVSQRRTAVHGRPEHSRRPRSPGTGTGTGHRAAQIALAIQCHLLLGSQHVLGSRVRRGGLLGLVVFVDVALLGGAASNLPAAQIRDPAAPRCLQTGESLTPFEPVGVGKTHIAQALGHPAVRQGANVRFSKTSRIPAKLAGGHADRVDACLDRGDVLLVEHAVTGDPGDGLPFPGAAAQVRGQGVAGDAVQPGGGRAAPRVVVSACSSAARTMPAVRSAARWTLSVRRATKPRTASKSCR
ncbi:ATP-binding protein [Streptacidiphilus anmyonensis]|uniref:ATP-binding protein n=1 Tax=Streptacidiphilus anmyonensis TaxID=405782 RepID=UPI0009FBA398|nr:ATP-binding protein [Streptacidiphilus anmyonensis]